VTSTVASFGAQLGRVGVRQLDLVLGEERPRVGHGQGEVDVLERAEARAPDQRRKSKREDWTMLAPARRADW
jgi:hypothetical protein